MSVNLDKVVGSLVETAPAGELGQVSKDLSTILDVDSLTINQSIENHINENGTIVSQDLLASKWNKQEGTTKYIDYINKKLFNVDLNTRKAIDIEEYVPDFTYPEYFNGLVSKLETYGQDHYPNTYCHAVIPKEELHIIIIGQKINTDNFYTGRWNSHYRIKDGVLKGIIKLDIHYYEDGNVRLNFEEEIEENLLGYDEIVNIINKVESNLSIKIVQSFNELNQKTFKNLRRLLPITRSKINWGNAIGNYRLGSDVVNKQ